MTSRSPFLTLSLLLVLAVLHLQQASASEASPPLPLTGSKGIVAQASTFDPEIAGIIAQVREQELLTTATELQNLKSRAWSQPGNMRAATYLYDRFKKIPGLIVTFQGGELSNVVATLQGSDSPGTNLYVIGAHYDSITAGMTNAPGATDNAAGIGVILEFARILSQHRFRSTLVFACWNREETGLQGSTRYVQASQTNGTNIKLYLNYDSCCFDPENRYILDIISNAESSSIREIMVAHISTYKIGFLGLTDNVHKCGGDYSSFWKQKMIAVSTHQETHGNHYHTTQDTIEKINPRYTRMNAQAGMSVVVRLAELCR